MPKYFDVSKQYLECISQVQNFKLHISFSRITASFGRSSESFLKTAPILHCRLFAVVCHFTVAPVKNKVWFMAHEKNSVSRIGGHEFIAKEDMGNKMLKTTFWMHYKAHCNRANKAFQWERGSQCQDHFTLWQPLFWLLYRSFYCYVSI